MYDKGSLELEKIHQKFMLKVICPIQFRLQSGKEEKVANALNNKVSKVHGEV